MIVLFFAIPNALRSSCKKRFYTDGLVSEDGVPTDRLQVRATRISFRRDLLEEGVQKAWNGSGTRLAAW